MDIFTHIRYLYLFLIVSISIVLATFSASCHSPNKHGNDNSSSQTYSIRTAHVTEEVVEDKIETIGSLYPAEEIIVSNKKAGKILRLTADLGDFVNKGSLLAQIDPIDYKLLYNESEARFQSTKTALEGIDTIEKSIEEHSLAQQAKANMDDAYLKMKRMEELVSQKLVSQQDYDSAKANYIASKAAYENTKTNLEKLKNDLLASKAVKNLSAQNLSDTRVVAPISGYIQKKLVSLGEFLNPYTPMFTLVQNNPLKLKATVPEKYAQKVKTGLEVIFKVDSQPDKTFTAKVSRVAPAVDEKTRTLEIEMLYDNSKTQLKPGVFATIVIDLGTKHKGLFVPENAIYTTVGINKLFTYENGLAVEHIIQPGTIIDNRIEVIGDLNLSDKIIITDVDKLSDGMPVKLTGDKGASK